MDQICQTEVCLWVSVCEHDNLVKFGVRHVMKKFKSVKEFGPMRKTEKMSLPGHVLDIFV